MAHGDTYDPDLGGPRMKAGEPAMVVIDPSPAPAPVPVDTDTPRLTARVAYLEDALLRQGLKLAETSASLLDSRDQRTRATAAAAASTARAVEAETRRDAAEAKASVLAEATRAEASDRAVLDRELSQLREVNVHLEVKNVEARHALETAQIEADHAALAAEKTASDLREANAELSTRATGLEKELERWREDLRDLEAERAKGNYRGVEFEVDRLVKLRGDG